jgi:hypothetical protein
LRRRKKESNKPLSMVTQGKEIRDGLLRTRLMDLSLHKAAAAAATTTTTAIATSTTAHIHLAAPFLKSAIGSKRMRRRKGHPTRAAEACL